MNSKTQESCLFSTTCWRLHYLFAQQTGTLSAMPAGHFIPEQLPEETAAALKAFMG